MTARRLSRRWASLDSRTLGGVAERLDEKSIEIALANRPDLIEDGLRVFSRQHTTPVGIIDLLCLDPKRNYVVVEVKKPNVDLQKVVGQITRYMGMGAEGNRYEGPDSQGDNRYRRTG